MESICQKVRFYTTEETENRLSTKIFNWLKKKEKRKKAHWNGLICSICIQIAKCLNVWFSSHFQFPKEAEIKNLQLLIQFHSHNAVFTVNTEQDSRGLPVLSQNHFHLKSTHSYVFISERHFSKCYNEWLEHTHNHKVLKLRECFSSELTKKS